MSADRNDMPDMTEAMKAEVERVSGGTVSFAPPVVTGKGWRATLHGGTLQLQSVTMKRGTTREDAMRLLMSRVVERLPA